MSDNLVIPLANIEGKAAAPFSLGKTAEDFKTPHNKTSAIATVDVLSAANAANGFAFLNPAGRTSLANAVTGYYKKYATGPSLFTVGTNNSNIRMSSLINAQALYVTITAHPETETVYHSAKDARIVVSFTYPDTWQRTAEDWVATTPDSTIKEGSYTITVNGAASVVINGNPYTAGFEATPASELRDGTYQITIKDNNSGFYMITEVVCPYGGTANVYYRCPGRQRTNAGAWINNTMQGYN